MAERPPDRPIRTVFAALLAAASLGVLAAFGAAGVDSATAHQYEYEYGVKVLTPIEERRGFACRVLDGTGAVHTTLDSYFVIYEGGNAQLRCEATGLPNPTGGIVTWKFANTRRLCDILTAGSTDVWSNRVGRAGGVQLTCQGFFNPGRPGTPSSSAGVR